MLSLHTSPIAQPGAGDAGGMNVYVQQLSRHLAAAGVPVQMVTVGDHDDVQLTENLWLRYIPLNAEKVSAQGIDSSREITRNELPRLLPQVTSAIKERSPEWSQGQGFDVLHSHYWMSGVAGVELSQQWGIPLVHSMHTMARVKNMYRPVGQAIEPPERVFAEEQITRKAAGLIANTSAEALELEQFYGGCAERITVVPPGVDLQVFTPGTWPRSTQDDFQVVFAGRWQALKGPHLLVEAVSRLRDHYPGLRLTILGAPSGETSYDLPGVISRLGMTDAVRLIDPLPAEKLAEHFRAADVVAMPSASESYGLVALEAQASATPVLATRVGGLAQIVTDSVDGFLVDDLDVSTWASALEKLITLGPDTREKMGLAGLRHARRHSWEQTARDTLGVYQRVRLASLPKIV